MSSTRTQPLKDCKCSKTWNIKYDAINYFPQLRPAGFYSSRQVDSLKSVLCQSSFVNIIFTQMTKNWKTRLNFALYRGSESTVDHQTCFDHPQRKSRARISFVLKNLLVNLVMRRRYFSLKKGLPRDGRKTNSYFFCGMLMKRKLSYLYWLYLSTVIFFIFVLKYDALFKVILWNIYQA